MDIFNVTPSTTDRKSRPAGTALRTHENPPYLRKISDFAPWLPFWGGVLQNSLPVGFARELRNTKRGEIRERISMYKLFENGVPYMYKILSSMHKLFENPAPCIGFEDNSTKKTHIFET